jgi:murein DD-endopeptidase MepM/ murein hydrolase activator NlpD
MSILSRRTRVPPVVRRSRSGPVAMLVVAVLAVAGGTGVVAAPCWEPPVVGRIVDPYRAPACRWCPGNRGIEYAVQQAARVRAVAAGTVTFSGSVAGVAYVVVEHANGWRTTYGGLRDVAVAQDARVVARTVVGTTTSRFHFGLRDRSGYRDPAPFLGRWVYRARLVPIDGSQGAPPGRPQLRCGADVPARPPDPR